MPQLNPFFVEGMIPAMIVFAILAAAFLGVPDPIVNNREMGIFRSYRINNVSVISILLIPALTTMVHLAVVAAIITVTAPLLFNAPLPLNWGMYVLSFFLIAFTCISLAILIGIIASNSRASAMWSQLVFIPSMLIGGLMIPLNILPEKVAFFSRLLPAAHGMNLFNTLAWGREGGFESQASVLVLAAGGVFSFLLALFLFRWDKGPAGKRSPVFAVAALIPFVAGMYLF